ncbi:MAG: ATP-binding protein [Planctomycetaceae bacterium]
MPPRRELMPHLLKALAVVMPPHEQHEVVIASDTTAGQAVQEQIVQRLEELQFPARDVFGVRLALEEGIVNAIKHGNQLDPAKSVRIWWQVSADAVRVEIEDQGPGFTPENVPDPTLDENLERPCGRGIMLMRAFMTHVEYVGRGNKLVLEKQRQPE